MKRNSVSKNYIYNLTYQILLIVLPIITTPYVSRALGAENVGIYSYTLSIVSYFILFGSLGIALYGQREIAYVRNDKEKTSRTFWEIICLRCLTMIIVSIIYYIIFANGQEYQIYYEILILEIIANMIDISWFFQGLEEFKRIVTRSIIIKIISVFSIFALVKTNNDLPIYILIYTISNVLGNVILCIYMPKYLSKIKFNSLDIKKHVKPTIALFIPQIAVQIYTILDKTMIGKILGDMSEVGNYEQSQKIIKMAMTAVTAIGTVVAPRIANIVATGKKEEVQEYLKNSYRLVWFLGIPIMLGLIAISKNLVPWFLGEGYERSAILINIGAILVMAIGLNNVSGMQYLIPTKKQNIYTKSVVIGAIFNFICNIILIPKLKSVGAILASALAEILILIVQLIYIRKDITLKIAYSNNMKYLISGIVMAVLVFTIGNFMSPSILTTIIQILIGAIAYIILLTLLKDKMIYELLEKLHIKRR